MNLGPWEAHVDPPGFTFLLAAVHIPPGSIVQVRGDNGAGKTVFLEQVLLPRLEAQKRRVFCITQDLCLQAHVLAATLAAQKIPVPRRLGDLVAAWCAAARADDIVVLDETDRHLDPEQMARLLARPVGAIFMVSHQERPWTATHCLSVTRRGREVTIQETHP